MAQRNFRTCYADSRLREIFFQIVRWAKMTAVLGLVFQLLMLAFALLHYLTYLKYAATYPSTAKNYLISGIFETILVAVYSVVFVLTYRSAVLIQRGVSEAGTDKNLDDAFSLNLRVLKIQFACILITAAYYIILLVRGFSAL